MRKAVFAALWSWLLLSCLLSGCTENKSDETLIREQIDSLQTAIEARDRGSFMAVIDDSYQDPLNSDRKSLQRMLMGYFLRYQDISVYATGHQIELTPLSAEVKSQVVVTGGKGLLPEDARHYQVVSCWNKSDEEWLLSCLEWQ